MKAVTRASIAYIAGRLISGKNITSLYDYSRSEYIDLCSLPDADRLREINYVQRGYVSVVSSKNGYQYSCHDGNSIEISVNGSSFIGHIRESALHFCGNVRGNNIYLYDLKNSSHFNFRISGCVIERCNDCSLVDSCSTQKKEF